jgi:hypothetical protein
MTERAFAAGKSARDQHPARLKDPRTVGLKPLTGPGRPLDPEIRQALEPRFDYDLSGVRVHTGHDDAHSAVTLGAAAYTAGQNIVFAPGLYQPGSQAGQRLLAHELAHVVQQDARITAPLSGFPLNIADDSSEQAAERSADETSAPISVGLPAAARGQRRRLALTASARPGPRIQRKVSPEDVSSEMIGQTFELTGPVVQGGTTLGVGTVVTATSWVNTSETAVVTAAGVPGSFPVAKSSLKPHKTPVAGIDQYASGVSAQAATVNRGEKEVAQWVAKKGQFKTPAAIAEFEKERTRREGLLATRRQLLNRRLIQETMFNRFDATIKSEVDNANKAHGLTGKNALDPNLVKAQLFEESQLGTSGHHLELPPVSHPVKTRFNLGQVIDSSGMALLNLLEAEHPDIVKTFSLGGLRKDLAAAQAELAGLRTKKTRTAAEDARLVSLEGLSGQNWETLIWRYKASGASFGFADAVNSFFAQTTPGRNVDYDFWIHVAVSWLFEKHRSGMSWPDAIKAYNGSGARANHYRDAIVNRAAAAKKAAATGRDFVPGNI